MKIKFLNYLLFYMVNKLKVIKIKLLFFLLNVKYY
jgi:hypothetical protein